MKMTISRKRAAAVILVAILVQRNKNRSRKKRLWVREFIRRREIDNWTQKMIQDLRDDASNTFSQFFRVSPVQFDFLLEQVRHIITKQDTNMRKAISAPTRLSITLRFLSSGDSYRSLMLLFRVPHNTISKIVSETCKAIYFSLRDKYLKVFL